LPQLGQPGAHDRVALQDALDRAGSAVRLLWKPGAPNVTVPVVPPEFAGLVEQGVRLERRIEDAIADADVVIGVGASLNHYTTEHGYLYPNAKYIHLDPKPAVMMGMGRSADIYLQTDGRTGVEALDALLAKKGHSNTGFRTGEVLGRLANQYEDRTEFELDPGTMDPRKLIRAVDELVPQDIAILSGSGASSATP